MVLEELLLFNDKEDAEQFVHFLKSRKCPARLNIQGSIKDELLLEGRLGGFFELLEYLESEYPGADDDDDDETDDDDDDSFFSDNFDDDVDEQGIPIRVLLDFMRKDLEKMWDYISDMMDRNQPGDLIFTTDELKEDLSGMISSVETTDEEDPRPVLLNFVRRLKDLQCLKQNGIVEQVQGGIVLTKRIDPADLVITRPLMIPDTEDDEEIRPYGVSHLTDTYYHTQYILTIDPKLPLIFTPFEIGEALVDLSVDEESMDDLLKNMFWKQQLVHVVVQIIEDAKVISMEKLVPVLDNYQGARGVDGERIGFYVSYEYLEAFIDDLRKLRVLQGNNDRIRLTNQKFALPGQ